MPLLAQVLDPNAAIQDLSTAGGPWPAYIAVFLALGLVAVFGLLVKVMRDHKAETKAAAEGYGTQVEAVRVEAAAQVAALTTTFRQEIASALAVHAKQLVSKDKRIDELQAEQTAIFRDILAAQSEGP